MKLPEFLADLGMDDSRGLDEGEFTSLVLNIDPSATSAYVKHLLVSVGSVACCVTLGAVWGVVVVIG